MMQKTGFGAGFATNPYKMAAAYIGIEDEEYVMGIIDRLTDGGYLEESAAVRLHITTDGVLPVAVTAKGRKKLLDSI